MAKNKLAKFAEMNTLPNVFQPLHTEIFRTDYKLKGSWNKEFFHNDNPIVLEIGCGKGEYTIELAKLYPEKNFIGIDIKGARIWSGAKIALEANITNVAFIRMYAEMLENAFAVGEISEIWITFPDPQMSRAGKRLSGSRFLSIYKNITVSNPIINLKTDSQFLYTYTSELIKANQLTEFVNRDDLYASGYEDKILEIRTFYESQWLSRGKTIKYIRYALDNIAPLVEPEVEIEWDDYHSQASFMSSKEVNKNTEL